MLTFQSRPLLDLAPDFQEVRHGQLDDFTLNEAGIGAATPWKPTSTVRRTIKIPFQFQRMSDWRDFRDFVEARRGRLEGFWLPIWLTDYPSITQTAGQNLIDMRACGLAGVFQPSGQFAFCALIGPTSDYLRPSIEPHEISSATVNGVYERLTLADAITGTFPPASSILCGLLYARIEDEQIDYEFITDGVIQCEVNFTELPKEYVASETITTPVYLFEFQRGGSIFRMTNYGGSIIAGGDLWSPENIDLGGQRSGLDFLSENVEVKIATDRDDHPLRYYIKDRRGFQQTALTIFQIDADNPVLDRTSPIYSGLIDASAPEKEGMITLTLSSIMRIGELNVPRPQVQRLCNLRNGEIFCGIDVAAFTTSGTVTGLQADDPPFVEANEFGAQATAMSDPNWFALGEVTIGNEVRMCVGQNGNRLYLDFGFLEASAGEPVSATAGDNKRIQTCQTKFNNLPNFLGTHLVPNRNPTAAAVMNPAEAGGKK